jgi:hypothetical protein
MAERTHRTDYESYIKDLAEFMDANGCSLRPFPKIKVSNQKQDGVFIKTAWYDPTEKTVTVMVSQRHIKDCLRSVAHEFVHHHQNLDGRLTGYNGDTIGQDEKLDELESEAYQLGNLLFRKWTETKTKSEKPQKSFTKHMKKKISIDENNTQTTNDTMAKEPIHITEAQLVSMIKEAYMEMINPVTGNDEVPGVHPNGQLDMFHNQNQVDAEHENANYEVFHAFQSALEQCGWATDGEKDADGGIVYSISAYGKNPCSPAQVQAKIKEMVPNSNHIKFGTRTNQMAPEQTRYIVFIPNHEDIQF